MAYFPSYVNLSVPVSTISLNNCSSYTTCVATLQGLSLHESLPQLFKKLNSMKNCSCHDNCNIFNLVRHQEVAEFHLQYCNICVLKRVDNALLYLQPSIYTTVNVYDPSKTLVDLFISKCSVINLSSIQISHTICRNREMLVLCLQFNKVISGNVCGIRTVHLPDNSSPVILATLDNSPFSFLSIFILMPTCAYNLQTN